MPFVDLTERSFACEEKGRMTRSRPILSVNTRALPCLRRDRKRFNAPMMFCLT